MADGAHTQATWPPGRDRPDAHGHADETGFAPARRASRAELEALTGRLGRSSLFRALLDVTDVSVIVLNRERQIVVGNERFLSSLCVEDRERVQGMRPGEALHCVHARAHPGGCGAAPECHACGAVLAILESQQTGGKAERDCLMAVEATDAVPARELRVRATQLELGDDLLTVVGLRDISDEKRRLALERIFVHDLANTLTGLATWSHLLARRATGDVATAAHHIEVLAGRLMHEVEEHRALIQAEAGTLAINRTEVAPVAVLEGAAAMLDGDPVTQGRMLVITPGPTSPIQTDEALLLRVLVNMLKNALEASPDGGLVRASAERTASHCELRVWNEGVIEPTVAAQVFKRSFSTKPGAGRGLGTFSMKLFGERYLGGKVGFTSTAADGTTFYIRLPG